MTRQEIVARLKMLWEGIERDGEVPLAALQTTFALALSDVCTALGLTDAEHDQVLGQQASAYVTVLCGRRIWPVEMTPDIPALPAIGALQKEGLCL